MRRVTSRVISSVVLGAHTAVAALLLIVGLAHSALSGASAGSAGAVLFAGGVFLAGTIMVQQSHPVARLVTGIAALAVLGVGVWLLCSQPINPARIDAGFWLASGEILLGCFVLFECLWGWKSPPDDVSPSGA